MQIITGVGHKKNRSRMLPRLWDGKLSRQYVLHWVQEISLNISPCIEFWLGRFDMNHYGKDMVNSLSQAVQFGLRDRQSNGKNFEIVVPLFSRLMAQGAGQISKDFGVYKLALVLKDAGTQAFLKSFGQEYGFPPSQAAHTCYVQTLLYANACEMAGTFYPPQ